MAKRTSQETSSSQPNTGGQEASSKKNQRLSPTRRILRDMLNLHPVRDEGGCWPTAVPRKK